MPPTYANDIQKTNHKAKQEQYNYFAIWEYCVKRLVVTMLMPRQIRIFILTLLFIATTTK